MFERSASPPDLCRKIVP